MDKDIEKRVALLETLGSSMREESWEQFKKTIELDKSIESIWLALTLINISIIILALTNIFK